ncbi:Global transcription regulator sge1 [Glugoides intestinalis]
MPCKPFNTNIHDLKGQLQDQNVNSELEYYYESNSKSSAIIEEHETVQKIPVRLEKANSVNRHDDFISACDLLDATQNDLHLSRQCEAKGMYEEYFGMMHNVNRGFFGNELNAIISTTKSCPETSAMRQGLSSFESCYCCVHSEADCKDIIDKTKQGVVKMVKRRLNEREKGLIRPGSVFVYNEMESGIKRWTDKKEWTPSRVQGCFLVYKELRGPLFKKTYTSKNSNGIYHVVAYTLADWETDCVCCTYIADEQSYYKGEKAGYCRLGSAGEISEEGGDQRARTKSMPSCQEQNQNSATLFNNIFCRSMKYKPKKHNNRGFNGNGIPIFAHNLKCRGTQERLVKD